MKQFCKLCIITAFYIVFWIPNAFHLSWNLIEPVNNSILSLSNIFYIVPFLLTPIIGLFVKKDEGILVFVGGILASLLQFGIASADSLTSFLHYWNQPFTYLPHIFKMFFQIIYVGICIILSSKIAASFRTQTDQNYVDKTTSSNSEEIVAATN